MASDGQTQVRVRLADELLETIERAREASKRSFNAEVQHALAVYYHEGHGEPKPHTLRLIRLTEEQLSMLSNLKAGAFVVTPESFVARGIELAAEELKRLQQP